MDETRYSDSLRRLRTGVSGAMNAISEADLHEIDKRKHVRELRAAIRLIDVLVDSKLAPFNNELLQKFEVWHHVMKTAENVASKSPDPDQRAFWAEELRRFEELFKMARLLDYNLGRLVAEPALDPHILGEAEAGREATGVSPRHPAEEAPTSFERDILHEIDVMRSVVSKNT